MKCNLSLWMDLQPLCTWSKESRKVVFGKGRNEQDTQSEADARGRMTYCPVSCKTSNLEPVLLGLGSSIWGLRSPRSPPRRTTENSNLRNMSKMMQRHDTATQGPIRHQVNHFCCGHNLAPQNSEIKKYIYTRDSKIKLTIVQAPTWI